MIYVDQQLRSIPPSMAGYYLSNLEVTPVQEMRDFIAKGWDEWETEPYRVCRRPLFLRECPDEKSKIHP